MFAHSHEALMAHRLRFDNTKLFAKKIDSFHGAIIYKGLKPDAVIPRQRCL
jgi:hypothetical protein